MSDKKIALMTWYTHRNYGTALQASALCETIRELGYKVTLINYKPRRAYEKRLTINELFKKAKSKILKKDNAFLSDEREKLYLQFLEDNTKQTKPLRTDSELRALNTEFDAFVCGSDQIWSPLSYNDKYFLSFVSDADKTVSYAPSFGAINITDENVKTAILKQVDRIKHLSVREKQGAELIKELTNRNAEVVLDPTLLIDANKWDNIVGKYSDKTKLLGDYILCYFLGNEKKYLKKVKKISKKINLPYYVIPVKNRHLKLKNLVPFEVGPADFITLIKNAKYVCTDSFHGVAFSVNYNVPFSVFKRFSDKDPQNQNSRIFNILDVFELKDRLYTTNRSIDTKIDFTKTNKKLNIEREKSLEYLKNALEIATHVKSGDRKKTVSSACCGCGACVAICKNNALSVVLDKKGFYHYKLDERKCINCGLCKAVCPMENVLATEIENAISLYSVKSKNDVILKNAASGGVGGALTEKFVKDEMYVGGCVYDQKTHSAKHVTVSTLNKEDIILFQGSKYIQSASAKTIEELFNFAEDKKIAFFGTPCQVAGLSNLLTKYGLRENAILVDLICHGVPTYYLWERYLDYLRKNKNLGEDLKVNFRDKNYPWHKRYMSVSGNNQRYVKNDRKDDFYAFFRRGLGNMQTCFECPYREKSCADVRIGDYWGERFINDKQGVSMVIANTKTGKNLIENLDGCTVKEYDLKEYWSVQAPYNPPKLFFNDKLIDELKDGTQSIHKLRKKYCTYYDRVEIATDFMRKIKRLIKR